jgi:glucose dehydrogenase
MRRRLLRFALPFVVFVLGVVWSTQPMSGQATGQPSTKTGEWPYYSADVRGSRYSPLD